MAKILVVEDDGALGESLQTWLSEDKHTVEVLMNGREAASHIKIYNYDIIILDWELPGITGLEICRQYRDQGGTTPIIMLTGKDTADDKTTGLDTGADDYLTKPFHLNELSARIRALLRRTSSLPTLASIVQMNGIELDTRSRRITKNGTEVHLLPREFALLEFLMRHPNEVFSPEDLLNRVWSSDSESSISTVYTYIKTLRRKIADSDGNSAIVNVHGVGYKLIAG